jgi:LPXTG-motif cell wall-anchored protein
VSSYCADLRVSIQTRQGYGLMALSTPTYPLTTIFTPPASCSSSWTYEAQLYNSVTGGLLIQNAVENGIDRSCFPPNFADNARGQASEIYSPGYCPSGYTSPAVFSGNGVTTGICCQRYLMNCPKSLKGIADTTSGFTYYTTLTTINFFSSTTIFAGCLSIYPESSGATTVRARANDTDLTTTAISGPISMWGQPVVVEFQQKDLTLFSTSTSSISSSTSSRSSGTASPSATTAQPAITSTGSPTPSTDPKSGLSTGAQAGIGVGVAIVALILLAIAAFFLRRKRKASQKPNNGSENKVELPTHESRPGELHGDHLFQYDQTKGSTRQGPVSELA